MPNKVRPHFSTDSSQYLRTVSYRDFATPFTISMVALTLMRLVDYAAKRWYIGNPALYMFIFLLVAFAANHYFYWMEHKRFNNFIGRFVQDAILFILFECIFRLFVYLENAASPDFASISLLPMLILLGVVSVCFESVIEVGRIIFNEFNRRAQ